ncbi:virion host shutoff protein-like protein [Prochlorococcus marinus str. MIT 9312]|uniref:Virion host shutoff protein-like protein n=1 Tax=Prochlorococcus marinus (strain MIT 9312) TaxID=74546 RepID=Q318Z5_PROM9|nr:hypothetical protein [Prochlorococcus marinus]ABB50550.1 virion host shutoff protein-like protein [Prochlorococcus marinus str. MIT 9312]KGG01445.1 putative Virion host shutoff protein [Prochlorococcus marinus str. MIT 9311]
MKLNSTFSIQDKKLKNLDNIKDFPTDSAFMSEQNVSETHCDYWHKECELNPSNPHCLVYED